MGEPGAEELALQAPAREFSRDVAAPGAASTDKSEQYPWESVAALRDAGFMGMTIPREYGGRGLSYLAAALAIEEIAAGCASLGRITVEANMGAIGAIMAYASEAQRHRAAELVLGGDKPAICITEPEAGSAATAMKTTAVRWGDHYILNGQKCWITGGGVSKLHLVFARLMEGENSPGIAGFIAIRGETEGLRIGAREPAMGVRGIPETEVFFEDMKLPADAIVLPPEGPAKGFKRLMQAYNAQRVGAGTVALGIARAAYEAALAYAGTRQQFEQPIAGFQGLRWMLADMSVALSAARALLHAAARSASPGGFPDMLAAAQAKVLASESAIKITSDALQIFGARGYSRNNAMERHMRDARMFSIAGGTAQILRNQIAGEILKTP